MSIDYTPDDKLSPEARARRDRLRKRLYGDPTEWSGEEAFVPTEDIDDEPEVDKLGIPEAPGAVARENAGQTRAVPEPAPDGSTFGEDAPLPTYVRPSFSLLRASDVQDRYEHPDPSDETVPEEMTDDEKLLWTYFPNPETNDLDGAMHADEGKHTDAQLDALAMCFIGPAATREAQAKHKVIAAAEIAEKKRLRDGDR